MAEDVKLVLRYRVEANAPLVYQKPILLMEGDKRANVLQVSLFDGEKPVDVTGLTVGGSVLRADGADVAIEGEIDGNVISCVLSEYAYAVAGPFKAFVQLLDSLGDVKRTVLLLAGMVESRGHGPQIDTGKELPSLDDILAQLETMRNVTQAANTAAGDANTAAAAANSAASKATGAANSATTAAGTANAAAGNADAAAARANDAAAEVESGTAPNSSLLDNKPPEYYLTPLNLLDNSWFGGRYVDDVKERLVYQAGLNGYHGTRKYPMDRWISWNADVTFADGYITPGSPIDQHVANIDVNKIYTVAMKRNDGSIISDTGTFAAGFGSVATVRAMIDVNLNIPNVRIGETQNVCWVALYEGAYTAETLPPYVPKPYAVELAECQKYYLPIITNPVGFGYAFSSGDVVIVNIPLPQPMRAIPTLPEGIVFTVMTVNGELLSTSAYAVHKMSGNGLQVNLSGVTVPAGQPCTVAATDFSLNLDL